MREELNKELESIQSAKESSTSSMSSTSSSGSRGEMTGSKQIEASLKSQIKHISEQIKCVGFLLMQAQLGLEAINDEMMYQKRSSSSSLLMSSPPRPPPPVIPEQNNDLLSESINETSEAPTEANLIELEGSGDSVDSGVITATELAVVKPIAPELIVTNSSQDESHLAVDDLSMSVSNINN